MSQYLMPHAATSSRWFRNSESSRSEVIADAFQIGIAKFNKPSLTAGPLKDHYLISGF
jgi:hypothetical protein